MAILIFPSISRSVRDRTAVQIAADVLSVLDGIALCNLSWLEHSRSARPSSLLGTFLLCTLLFDCARTRTAWRLGNQKLGSLLVVSDALKSVSLFLEAREKQSSVGEDAKQLGPEDTSGIYSRSFFWWLNSLLRHGFREIFVLDDLFPIAQDVLSEKCFVSFREGLVYMLVFSTHDQKSLTDTLSRSEEQLEAVSCFISRYKVEFTSDHPIKVDFAISNLMPATFVTAFT